MALVRAVEGNIATQLDTGWECAPLAPGAVHHPSALDASLPRWLPAVVPGTAASSLAAISAWNLDAVRDFDAEDWWYRLRVPAEAVGSCVRRVLRLEGLATLADLWIDGEHLLRSENMFVEHAIDVTDRLSAGSEIAIRFGALGEELKKRRPRPRWRSRLVAQQQLRWLRTSLIGRIPGWMPPVAPVGPYRPVVLESISSLDVRSADLRMRVDGTDGLCEARIEVRALAGEVEGARLRVGAHEADLACERAADGATVLHGVVRIPRVALWWPATHGTPALHDVRCLVRTTAGACSVDLGRTGFRTLQIEQEDGGFGLRVNGVDVFCRGAVWTPLDVVGLREEGASLRAAMDRVVEAGMNMLRVCGTMSYPTPAFVDACNERGILVWHDFMFATLDYPASDAVFSANVRAEAEQVVGRLQHAPSTAVLCGNTEGQQQVAMLGLPASERRSSIFDDLLPAIVAAALPGVPYVPSTPTGGPLPFRVDTGVSHYYGVGAYRRPIEDARRSRVRFTTECLGFANVPSTDAIDALMDGAVPTQHPRWKARVPRDSGTPWDFDDVRDHYLRELFGVEPVELRALDVERYLTLSRLASAEAMAGAMAEWRRTGSDCRGALVWFLQDLWAGAGWGIVDAAGRPKAPYYFLKRLWQPVAVIATDEGLNGLAIHVANDRPVPLDARLKIALYRDGETPVAEGTGSLLVPAHGIRRVDGDAVLERFVDTTYAYRFGPPGHDLVVVSLFDADDGAHLGRAFHFPVGRHVERHADLGLEASAETAQGEDWLVAVRTRRFAYAVTFDAPGFVPCDEFFHVEPGGTTTVLLRRNHAERRGAAVRLLAANASTAMHVRPPPAPVAAVSLGGS